MSDDLTNHTGNEVTDKSLRMAIVELAGDAKIRYDGDMRPVLVRDLPQPSNIDVLFHRGWLESMPNGGTFKLSDAGLLAYLRSTDELGDGRLLHPREWQP